MLTPLSAPVASCDDLVALVDPAGSAAEGRAWKVVDIGEMSTLSMFRTTSVNQNTQAASGCWSVFEQMDAVELRRVRIETHRLGRSVL